MVGFIIWALAGVVFIGMGIYLMVSGKKTAAGFWANAETLPMENVKAHNKAVGKLWCVFGFVFLLLGLPLLAGQNSPLIVLTIIGTMIEAIVAMAVYVMVIEKKYRKKKDI